MTGRKRKMRRIISSSIFAHMPSNRSKLSFLYSTERIFWA